MNRRFTLIELIVTIIALSLIAAIVLINIKDSKKSAIIASIETNRSIIQSASDAYYLQRTEYPIEDQKNLTLSSPQLIDIEQLVKEGYLKKELDTSKIKTQYYWVDVFGRVWGATTKEVSPINLINKKDNSKSIEFTIDNKFSGFDVYEVTGYTHLLSANIEETDKKSYKVIDSVTYKGKSKEVVNFNLPKQNANYLISMKDEYGLELPPTGKFNGLKSPSYRGEGTYQFEINNAEEMYWVDFWTLEEKKGNSTINYRFKVKDKNGEFLPWTTDFFSLPESKHIVVEIEIKSDADGNTAAVYDVQVLFKYKTEIIVKPETPQCDLDCYEEGIICPASPFVETYANGKGGKIVTPFYIKGKKSIENTYIVQPVLPKKHYKIKQVSYYVENNGQYELVEDTEQLFQNKCAVAIFDVEALILDPKEPVDKEKSICGTGGSRSVIYGKTKKLVYNFILEDKMQITSIHIQPMENLNNIYIEQSVNGQPFEIIDSLLDIQTPSCVNIVYEFENDINKPNPPVIHGCQEECPKINPCVENCISTGPNCFFNCEVGKGDGENTCKGTECSTEEYCKDEYSECETPPCVENCNPVLNDPEWVTVESIRFFGNGPLDRKTRWLEAISENEILDKENTRIVYNYAKKNGNGNWSGLYEDFKKTGVASAVMAVAFIQVKVKAVDTVSPANYPFVKSLIFESEAGDLPASMTNPSLIISPKKDNNIGRDVFSNASKITWETDVADPRNLKITNIEWSGDVREQYPVGKYTIRARATNERGYTSEWVSYSLEVLEEKPIASYSIQDYSKHIPTDMKISFNQFESIDPDGDEIVNYEWKNKKTTYSKEDVGPIKISLRVQDEEGHWSDWFERDFVIYDINDEFWFVDGIPAIAAGYGEVFDKNDTTQAVKVGNITVTWKGSIEGETLYLYSNLYTYQKTELSFFDENNNALPFLTSSELYSDKYTLENLKAVKIIVPKGARSMRFTGSEILLLKSIHLIDKTSGISKITNITDKSNKFNHIAEFKKDNSVSSTYFIDSKGKVYNVKGERFVSDPIEPDTNEPYKVISVDSNFIASEEITTYLKSIPNRVNFYGLPIEAFDEDDSSAVAAVSTPVVTWDSNIEGETLYILANLYTSTTNYISFYDENQNALPFLTDSAEFTNKYSIESRKAVRVIVPKGAKSLNFTGKILSLRSIHLIEKNKTVPTITNVVDKSAKFNHIAEFKKDSSITSTYFIDSKNKVYDVKNTIFTSNSVTPDTSEHYKVISVDSNFIASETINVNLKSLPSDINFYGLPIEAFDENDSTFLTAIKPPVITWDKDITGETLYIFVNLYTGGTSYISFHDDNNNPIPFKTKNGTEVLRYSLLNRQANEIIVPDGAKSLNFSGSNILNFRSLHLVK